MNRQIEFRGKRIDNGEFIYGHLYQSKNESWITDSININISTHKNFAWWQVDPLTISQFTGIHDINRNKIFENDMVEWGGIKVIVKYKQEACQFWLVWDIEAKHYYKPLTATFSDGEYYSNDSIEIVSI